MKIVLFCHSLVSDWNHGNAHFLRGVVRELEALGHFLSVWEPRDSWSRANLVRERGAAALADFEAFYPSLWSQGYDAAELDLDRALDGAGLVLVHEWSPPTLVARLGEHRRRGGRYLLFFHDTHHRAITAPAEMGALELAHYDGVLAFGEVLRETYLARGWARAAWTWHEAADPRVFHPIDGEPREGDLAWIGNWGDDERTRELREYLIEPVRALRLRATVHGVRYPAEAERELASAGIRYRGWIANPCVPRVFARHAVAIHVPRGPYARALPGIPTIRVFEALACGSPLVCAPWEDSERLFAPDDYVVARSGAQMRDALRALLADPDDARERAERARRRLLQRHTCRHRALELLELCAELGADLGGARTYANGTTS